MTRYDTGDKWEKEFCRLLERHGHPHWWQSRGSHGVADVIALDRYSRLLVQVRRRSRTPELRRVARAVAGSPLPPPWKMSDVITHAEWNTLYDLACDVGGVALVAAYLGPKAPPSHRARQVWPALLRIDGLHHMYAQSWPATPFDLSRVA